MRSWLVGFVLFAVSVPALALANDRTARAAPGTFQAAARQWSATRATGQRARFPAEDFHGEFGREGTTAVARLAQSHRVDRVRRSAQFFQKIVGGDYSGEYVVHRNRDVTAFLDFSDPAHPNYRPPTPEDAEPGVAEIAPNELVHVIVVPNWPREHIAQRLGGPVQLTDLQAATRVMEEAHRIATEMNVENPRIYLNSETTIGVAYLHVHIVGRRGPRTAYPAPLR